MTVISGPVPPYSNPPIQPEFYKPHVFVISDIALRVTTTVTTLLDNDYVIGQEIRLLIPPGYGCRQLNGQTGIVLLIPASNEVVVDIFSLNADPFISASLRQKPQIVAVGDVNTGIISSTGRVQASTNIPGSFINIS